MIPLLLVFAGLGIYGLSKKVSSSSVPTGPTVRTLSTNNKFSPDFFPTSNDVRRAYTFDDSGPLIYNPQDKGKSQSQQAQGSGGAGVSSQGGAVGGNQGSGLSRPSGGRGIFV